MFKGFQKILRRRFNIWKNNIAAKEDKKDRITKVLFKFDKRLKKLFFYKYKKWYLQWKKVDKDEDKSEEMKIVLNKRLLAKCFKGMRAFSESHTEAKS